MTEPQPGGPPPRPDEAPFVAVIRALARERALHWRGRRLWRGRQRLRAYAPHLALPAQAGDTLCWRAVTDGLGLRLRLSDEALHQRLAPPVARSALARALFDLFEQCRVESLAGPPWPGVQRNLAWGFGRWSEQLAQSRLVETADGLLLFTAAQAVHARVSAQPLPEALAELTESTRARLSGLAGPALAALRRRRHDQAAYAVPARAIAEAVAAALAASDSRDGPAAAARAAAAREAQRVFGLARDHDAADDAALAVAGGVDDPRRLDGDGPPYRAYTTAYDRELRPARALRAQQLDAWRQQLDARVRRAGVDPARLAAVLQRRLADVDAAAWVGPLDEGLVDGRRLARLVATPTERQLFRQPQAVPRVHAVVGLLFDCSGSMRRHAESLALIADLVARACEQAGVACEVLGHSTGAWHGGRALRDWQRAGRPPRPGRLNELAHLVFKDAGTPWRRARRDLAALLDPRMYREGVDGEAVDWAAARLRGRPERRKCLLVVADGCPMDSATLLANDAQLLDRHLHQVVAAIEDAGDIELSALGTGPELAPYFRRRQVVDLDAGLGPGTLRALVAGLAPARSR